MIAHHIWLLHIHIHSHHRVGLLLTHHTGGIIELHLLGLLRWHAESWLIHLHLGLEATGSHHRSETGSGTLALPLHHAEASTAETSSSGWQSGADGARGSETSGTPQVHGWFVLAGVGADPHGVQRVILARLEQVLLRIDGFLLDLLLLFVDFHLILLHRVEIEKTATEGITGFDSCALRLLCRLSRVKKYRLSLRRHRLLRLRLSLRYCIIATEWIEWCRDLSLSLWLSGCRNRSRRLRRTSERVPGSTIRSLWLSWLLLSQIHPAKHGLSSIIATLSSILRGLLHEAKSCVLGGWGLWLGGLGGVDGHIGEHVRSCLSIVSLILWLGHRHASEHIIGILGSILWLLLLLRLLHEGKSGRLCRLCCGLSRSGCRS